MKPPFLRYQEHHAKEPMTPQDRFILRAFGFAIIGFVLLCGIIAQCAIALHEPPTEPQQMKDCIDAGKDWVEQEEGTDMECRSP